MHICRYYHDDDYLPPDIRAALEDRLFVAFAGREAAPAGPSPAAPSPPSAIGRTIDRLTSTIGFTSFTRDNARLCERLAHEAIHWVGERWGELERTDPFAPEEEALRGEAPVGGSSPDVVEGDLPRLAATVVRHRPELAGLARIAATSRIAETSRVATAGPIDARLAAARATADREARRDLLLGRWRSRLDADRDAHRARVLGRALGPFVRELEGLVPRLEREQRLVRDVLGNEDALWDLSRHDWEELPLGGLEEAAQMLGRHPEIGRLAEILGRSRSVTERRTRIATERRVRRWAVGIGKSEVTGFRAGDDLTSLVASEVALLARPETEELFYAKLAHRQLLVLDYNRERIVEDVELRPVSVTEETPVLRGPAVVCVDTSGSMLGLPERVAKATVLALARRMTEERRGLEVIAFSSEVRSFSLDHENTNLTELAGFLAGSFHGGTDLGRALSTALEALEQAAYRHADVLVVSDFRVPKIADRHMDRISRQHRAGTLFHSLTVAAKPVIDPLHIFDTSWLFNTESGRIAPESLRAIR